MEESTPTRGKNPPPNKKINKILSDSTTSEKERGKTGQNRKKGHDTEGEMR